MSEEPRYLVRNRGVISLLLEIQELRLVVKAQLFDGKVMEAPPPPCPSHRAAPYDVSVILDPIQMMPLHSSQPIVIGE